MNPERDFSKAMIAERTVTIQRPSDVLYEIWRSLESLPDFMANLESVKKKDEKHSHWIARSGDQRVEWDAEIINDIKDELIEWRSLPGSEIETSGLVAFRPAPGERGTEVKVKLRYNLPGGAAARLAAGAFGKEPDDQVREDLRRFKALMEAGEVPTTEKQPRGGEK